MNKIDGIIKKSPIIMKKYRKISEELNKNKDTESNYHRDKKDYINNQEDKINTIKT